MVCLLNDFYKFPFYTFYVFRVIKKGLMRRREIELEDLRSLLALNYISNLSKARSFELSNGGNPSSSDISPFFKASLPLCNIQATNLKSRVFPFKYIINGSNVSVKASTIKSWNLSNFPASENGSKDYVPTYINFILSLF